MFMVALLTIAKNWKQPKRPSPGEWVNCSAPPQRHTTQQRQEQTRTTPHNNTDEPQTQRVKSKDSEPKGCEQ